MQNRNLVRKRWKNCKKHISRGRLTHILTHRVELLGDETNTDYFKEVNNIVYYLGDERGFISIDSEWLVIMFDNDVVVEV